MVCWLHREGPQLLLAKVKKAFGRIGIFYLVDLTEKRSKMVSISLKTALTAVGLKKFNVSGSPTDPGNIDFNPAPYFDPYLKLPVCTNGRSLTH